MTHTLKHHLTIGWSGNCPPSLAQSHWALGLEYLFTSLPVEVLLELQEVAQVWPLPRSSP